MAGAADDAPERLGDWLPRQRWFQGKDRTVLAVEVTETADLDDVCTLAIAEVRYDGRPPEHYQVPLVADPAGPLVVDGRRWADATGDPDAMRTLADRCCTDGRSATSTGRTLAGRPVSGARPEPGAPVRKMTAEQSNTSVVIGDAWILKVLRRLEPGIHPDIEITAALTAQGFDHVPTQHGSLALESRDGEDTALAVLSTFVPGSAEAWALAVGDTAAGSRDLIGPMKDLGAAVGDLHAALAAAFGAAPADASTRRGWADAMHSQLGRVLDVAVRRAPEQTADVRARADEITARFRRLATTDDAGPVTRVHGDLHLGQVLRGRDGRWLLLDFEGEPLKSIPERRASSSPLRDVAGMLRSFDYAAAEPHGGSVPREAAAWRDDARDRFLDGYRARAASLLPPAAGELLVAWELDKAVYELGYELANRPGWVPIPVGGILRLLDAD